MYQLSPNVYACTTGRNCMFLDLMRDRYLSVPQALMDELAPQIRAWHLPSDPQRQKDLPQTDLTQLINDLLAAGILRPCGADLTVRSSLPPTASRDLTSIGSNGAAPATRIHRGGVFSALVTADFALRRIPLAKIVQRISSHPTREGDHHAIRDHNSACALTTRFLAFRPWYPKDYVCLFDSLALTLFLLRHRIRASWVFGVREDPFAAHCWVQYGTTALNDHLDRTRLYTPIMAV